MMLKSKQISIWIFIPTVLTLFFANYSLGQQNGELLSLNNNQRERSNDINTMSQTNPDPIKVQYVNVNGLPVLVQFTYVGPPKILPIATADSYPEGSSINLICTVSGGQRKGLMLSWRKDGHDLDEKTLRNSEAFDNVSIGTDDADISILKIKNATYANSGTYSCTATNPLGRDSTSVNIVINGK